ncbi:unnamed protein product (macronuclear) [Paramecium tetraurelia]|uniref:Uncharacterized protein n=1 Tax=Paramecium tetraurelia TaxID=5888 RepID=A0BFJ9_PARTE|nr:uncharacterized protein GSPATT00028351001 [Paramecium tetraurelia]CAK57316.1 unnamed protein product [Paramecium tetraurelia]|eukprot:XP_001424714.1 hypothetical protein (macronuclear) [Paramecium tetraurelia strain d4-2]
MEPPISFLEILNQPLIDSSSKLSYFKMKYAHQSNKFNQLRICTEQNLISDSLMINLNIQSPNFKVHQKFDYNQHELTIHSQIITQQATPKSSRSASPLRRVYLSSSLVARRQFNDYVKCNRSPDPYDINHYTQDIHQQRTKKVKKKETDTSALISKTTYHLSKYGI